MPRRKPRLLACGGPVGRPFVPFPRAALATSIVDRFEATVRLHRGRLAVGDASGELSYSELSTLVDRIAIAVERAVGEGRGPVAILLANDIRFPAAILGVLAAGRGFIPLDVKSPTARNDLIIRQSGAAAVLTAGDLAAGAALRLPSGLPIVDVEANCGGAPAAVAPTADDLACIVYTSGSTGTPKGVQHSHRNLLHVVMHRTNALHVSHEDRFGLLYPPTSIAGLRDIFTSLLNGASLHILPPTEFGPVGLVREIEMRGITVFRTAPSLLRRLAQTLGPHQRLDSVRVFGLGGERVDWSDFEVFKRVSSPNAFMHTGIGPTECGGQFSDWFVDRRLRNVSVRLPVGRDLPDVQVAVLDEAGQPVADGEVGEFVVAGRYISQGYWRDPELTASAFTIDAADPEVRIFKTGDWGRRREDGLIEFIGRRDQQIKLHGHRIETGEIESALRACADVEDAAVVVRRDENNIARALSAYVEPEPDVDCLTQRDLVAALRERLPVYMVPAIITLLDELPRLPNFKIDREELRRRDQRQTALRHAAPDPQLGLRSKIEETLLELWSDVFDRQDIGYDDDFFHLGGDSVAAIDLLFRIEEELQYQVPLTILAEAPTVSQLAWRLETATLGSIQDMIRIHTDGTRRPLFAVHGAGGHALALLPVLRSLGPDQPCYGLQPPGLDWTGVGCETLSQIAAYYIGRLKVVQPHGPYRLLGVSFGGLVVLEMALQLQKSGESLEFLGMVDSSPPTCVVEGEIHDSRSRWAIDALSPSGGRIEALNQSIIETQLRMRHDHVLDSRLSEHVFRGELTYFHCTGNPVAAHHDRRRLWRSFASQFRLLQLPGAHGTQQRDPQYTALRNLLTACLNDEPVTGIDPADVYDRDYRIINDRDQPMHVLSSTGELHRFHRDGIQGFVEEVRIDAETIRVTGWAVEPCKRQPAQTIAIFLDDQFIGYGASGESRPDVAETLGAASALFAGFNFIFDGTAVARIMGRLRLFVLSSDGRVAELQSGIKPVVLDSVKKFSNSELLEVILSGNWSSREPWGVWSDGPRAAVVFDSSSLPDRFAVAIQAHLFPPGRSPTQTVRVSDDDGNVLMTISNQRPIGKPVVIMQKSPTRPRRMTSLIFDIDAPVSPNELGINADRRKLGIALESLTFQQCNYFTRGSLRSWLNGHGRWVFWLLAKLRAFAARGRALPLPRHRGNVSIRNRRRGKP
jgi:amino acid adenylation domain-containing protein